MSTYRQRLPQHGGGLFLTDAGPETDLVFNRGIDVPHFAAHTLLESTSGREHLADYFRGFLSLAWAHGASFVLDTVTWKAHAHWASDLRVYEHQLKDANVEAVRLATTLRDEFAVDGSTIVLNGVVGPKGDAYAPETAINAMEAQNYHAQQIGWLADTHVEMVAVTTFSQSAEAIGFVRAARAAKLPAVVSITVETDGNLPTGQSLADAIMEVDLATNSAAEYYMINCARPDDFRDNLHYGDWLQRLRGLRCNASRCSHAELDECEQLDSGNPQELGRLYGILVARMPWVNVVGGCCDSDLRHVAEMATAVSVGRDAAVGL